MAIGVYFQNAMIGTLAFASKKPNPKTETFEACTSTRTHDGSLDAQGVSVFASKVIGKACVASELAPGLFGIDAAQTSVPETAKGRK